MKTKEIVRRYNIDGRAFEQWLKTSRFSYRTPAIGGLDVEESDVKSAVQAFQAHLEEERDRSAHEREEQERAKAERAAAVDSVLLTTGYNFEGYRIIEYSGYISGDDAVQVDRGTAGLFARATDVGASLMASLENIRRTALLELKGAAVDLGCNAVIGVDFDYLTLDPETASSNGGTMYLPYVFGVTANGTAVTIER